MQIFARIAPPNSLLFISDVKGGAVPDFIPGQLILSTSSSISVGCLMWQDGETDVSLGAASEVDPGENPAFDGMLDTPNQTVIVSTVERETILAASASGRHTRVRIWVNRPQEPDKIIIGLG
jgi:hypothetical protein